MANLGAMLAALPLAGLRIVVTRPQKQTQELAHTIEALGGVCIQFPLLEISALTDTRALDSLAAQLHEYQLAIFISPNAVRYGMDALKNLVVWPASLQVATIGLSSAQALHEHGIPSVISPQQRFDSEALLALPEMHKVNGLRIIILRGDKGRELLGDTLTLRGATVEYVTCYHRHKPQQDISVLLAAKPNVLSVSSSEALGNLWQMLDAVGRENILALPIFVSHERIALAARKLGWNNVVTSSGGDEGLLTALLGLHVATAQQL